MRFQRTRWAHALDGSLDAGKTRPRDGLATQRLGTKRSRGMGCEQSRLSLLYHGSRSGAERREMVGPHMFSVEGVLRKGKNNARQ